MDWLARPEVWQPLVTAVATVTAVVLGPWVANKLKLTREKRTDSAEVEMREIDHTEHLFQVYRGEVDRYMARIRTLEDKVDALARWKATQERFVHEVNEDVADLIRLVQAVTVHGNEEQIDQINRLLEQMQRRVQSRLSRTNGGAERTG